MRYAYFPGCSAQSTGISYTRSYDVVARYAGIELNEIPDWNCCGATSAHAESELLGDALSARSLALAEEAFGNTPVLAPCAGCYLHLKTAQAHAQEKEETRKSIESLIQRPWMASAEVVNGLQPFLEPGIPERLAAHVCRPLTGLKVACYYGCALLRPAEVCHFDDDEQPSSMESLISLTEATPVEWSFKNECCGASHQVTIPQAGRTMIRRILENAAAQGADVIACACPLCMLNLDMREVEVNAARKKEGLPLLDIPVYYFTELLAESMGAPRSQTGTTRHFHPAANLHERAKASHQRDLAKAEAKRKEQEEAKKARAAQRKKKAAKAAAQKAASKKNKEVEA